MVTHTNTNMKGILTACLFLLYTLANAQVQVPERIIGNWINTQSNNWEYGFFEQFAIYESDFWNYESIQPTKKGIRIKIRNGNKAEVLVVTDTSNTDSSLVIARNQGKPVKFRAQQKGFIPYPNGDHKTFKNSDFKQDTVTIIGYYRNLEQYKRLAQDDLEKGPFSVGVPNFIHDDDIKYFADFDSLGRFEIKFPALNTQDIYVDWRRLTHHDVVEPGETLFLYADMADYIWDSKDTSWESFIAFDKLPKRIFFMGAEPRIHNELAHYKGSDAYIDRIEVVKKISSDLDFLDTVQANYKERIRHLEKYLKTYPTLSDRFKEFQFAYEKYNMAFDLMQHRFDKMRSKEIAFDKGYMEFINSNMEFSNERLYTLVREYSNFTRDYVGYYESLRSVDKDPQTGQLRQHLSVSDIDALKYLAKKGVFNEEEKDIIDAWIDIQMNGLSKVHSIKDSASDTKYTASNDEIMKKYIAIKERPEIKKVLPELISQLLNFKRMNTELEVIDSLFSHQKLKELLVARTLFKMMDQERVPLSEDALEVLNERITYRPIKNYILGINNQYISINNKKVSYSASLKNTEHLKEAKDADSLFRQLIAPYRRKVIYVDFWGTWCGPCLQQMTFAGNIKKEFAGKDVVFMYLASGSTEKPWTNVIKQMDLSGENVVHYRLPDEQQNMVERKFGVNSFPTYLLFDKDGKLVNNDAPRPEMKEALVSAINKLLEK